MARRKRVLVSLSDETFEEIKKISDEKGVSMSSIINLSIQGGFIALKLSMKSEWQKHFEILDTVETGMVINGKKK
jgi:hypothetical protein